MWWLGGDCGLDGWRCGFVRRMRMVWADDAIGFGG